MPLEIAQLGQPVLRQVAVEVAPEKIARTQIQEFIDMMKETLGESKGVGLAAPQVFVSLRIFLAGINPPANEDEMPGMEVCINPRLTTLTEERDSDWEGCLSFPELLVKVPRFRAVRLEYLTADGSPRTRDLEGFEARVVQHELDHLDGVLTLDRALSTRDIIKASELEAIEPKKDDEEA